MERLIVPEFKDDPVKRRRASRVARVKGRMVTAELQACSPAQLLRTTRGVELSSLGYARLPKETAAQ